MRVKTHKLEAVIPWIGRITFVVDEVQEKAAWSLYVELITRVTLQPLDDDRGLLREALNSLYTIFGITRTILKDAGPAVATGPQSLGPVAIAILNRGLRPFLSKWHPELLAYEQIRPNNANLLEYERNWPSNAEMRQELVTLQSNLAIYTDILAQISGATSSLQGSIQPPH